MFEKYVIMSQNDKKHSKRYFASFKYMYLEVSRILALNSSALLKCYRILANKSIQLSLFMHNPTILKYASNV